MSVANAFAFADFFCGSGLVTEALKPDFRPVWANDHDPRKLSVYAANHGPDHLRPGKIEEVRGGDLPAVDLSWGSFPCQDLSLAGKLAGLAGGRSGLVRQWLRVLDEMPRMPGVVALENVQGLVSAGRGDHYREVHVALEERGYRVGCLLLNAMDWVPQSRPRVFVIGLRGDDVPVAFRQDGPGWQHPQAVRRAAEDLGDFVWWKLPRPKSRVRRLEDLIEWDHPVDAEPVSRHNMGLIPTSHRTRLDRALAHGFKVAPGYRRTRAGRQVLELRFDGVSGCLRTPGGGSSRQLLVMRRDGPPATRFLSAREAARLMGAPDSYRLPTSYNDAYRAMGDAVVVPVVRHLSRHLLRPLAEYLRAEQTGRHETDPGLKFRLPE